MFCCYCYGCGVAKPSVSNKKEGGGIFPHTWEKSLEGHVWVGGRTRREGWGRGRVRDTGTVRVYKQDRSTSFRPINARVQSVGTPKPCPVNYPEILGPYPFCHFLPPKACVAPSLVPGPSSVQAPPLISPLLSTLPSMPASVLTPSVLPSLSVFPSPPFLSLSFLFSFSSSLASFFLL